MTYCQEAMKIITRFAPSPTGILHIGNLRTALFSKIYTENKNGVFILRIDDSNQVISKSIFIINIINYLVLLKISFNNGPYFQSLRINRYKKISFYLKKKGNILKIDSALFLQKNKNVNLVFYDKIKGIQKLFHKHIMQFLIFRYNHTPVYNFCCAIDDIDMKISHIIRGEDHLTNTFKQIYIFILLNCNIPQYIHLPLILHKTKKLSKKHNKFNIKYLINYGYLINAIRNYILSLGFSYKNKEIYSDSEMNNLFSLDLINKSPCQFNEKKLNWFNKKHIHLLELNLIKNELMNNKLFIQNKILFLCNQNFFFKIIKKKKIFLYEIIVLLKELNIYSNHIKLKKLDKQILLLNLFCLKKLYLFICLSVTFNELQVKKFFNKIKNVKFIPLTLLIKTYFFNKKNILSIFEMIILIGKKNFLSKIHKIIDIIN